ncbi:type IV pilus modification PilV family protein [Mangrovihabitans endophyticus]|uniref:Prepilin-type N-terminal cleavage/methylation domain-containing protein n=1 Tax=Mangrovihabitans endophyticus TaxID=1751298 RepID=A0A8J3BX73_9ACTN|nr:type II secretion system protein [Mangrovihabitans endophyticus]GGK86482.1 hypothetical protein GCM10012284_20870 [Mangrovihabitans endophyticus]
MTARKDPADAGFTLVEVLSALAVIGVVLTAVTTFFIRSMVVVDLQGARQTAIRVASSGMEELRAVSGQLALTWLTKHADPVEVQMNGITYHRGWDVPPSSSLITATVHVTWRSKGCPDDTCSYSTSTLISTSSVEPVFDPAAP